MRARFRATSHTRGIGEGGRVIVATEVFAPQETATAHILTTIAEALKEDFPVHVVTVAWGDSTGANSETGSQAHILRLRLPWPNDKRLLPRLFRSAWSALAIAGTVAVRVRSGDAVLAVTNPPILVPCLAVIAALRRVRLVVIVHDVFPDNLRAAGISGLNWLVPLLRRFSSFGLRHASTVVVIGRDMGEFLESKYRVLGERIEFIPNWADVPNIDALPAEVVPSFQEWGLAGKFVVEFAGNIGRVQGIENLLNAARLIQSVPEIQMLIVGDGARSHVVRNAIESGKVSNVTYVGRMPRAMQSEFLNACHVGIISLASGMLGLGVPSKLYNLLAAGKPIIAVVDEESEVARVILDERLGWVVPPEDPGALAGAIRAAFERRAELSELGARSRAVAETQYSQDKIVERYRRVFESAVASKHG